MDLHTFAPGKYLAKLKKTQGLNCCKDGKCHICLDIYNPSFLVCKCSIYYLCPIFTPRFLHFYDIFARSKFVRVRFFVQFSKLIGLKNKLRNCLTSSTTISTWSSEACKVFAICRANPVPSFLSFSMTLSIYPAPRIETASSRSDQGWQKRIFSIHILENFTSTFNLCMCVYVTRDQILNQN